MVSKYHARWMTRKDMPTVLEIEQNSFEYPWSEEEFIRTLRQRNCIGIVAVDSNEDVKGYAVYELTKFDYHILNICTHPFCKFEGVGRSMVEYLVGRLDPQNKKHITAAVRETNLNAQLFFKAMGFWCMGIHQGYYDDSDEAAYMFLRSIDRRFTENLAGMEAKIDG